MNLETKITIYKFTPQVFTLTLKKLLFIRRLKKYLCSFALNDKGICMYWG